LEFSIPPVFISPQYGPKRLNTFAQNFDIWLTFTHLALHLRLEVVYSFLMYLCDNGQHILRIYLFHRYLTKLSIAVVTYEGWNFNSGNYLFTTDTK